MNKPRLILINVLFFIITAAVAVFVVPLDAIINGFDWVELTACVVLIWMSGMSITAGYHRLWSHKAYEAHTVIRVLFAIFAGSEIMGFVGVLIALPMAAAIGVLVRFVIDQYLESNYHKDEPNHETAQETNKTP